MENCINMNIIKAFTLKNDLKFAIQEVNHPKIDRQQ